VSVARDLAREGGDAWLVLEDLAREKGWVELADAMHAMAARESVVLSFSALIRATPSRVGAAVAARAMERVAGRGVNASWYWQHMTEPYQRVLLVGTYPKLDERKRRNLVLGILAAARRRLSPGGWREELLQQIQDIIELDPKYG